MIATLYVATNGKLENTLLQSPQPQAFQTGWLAEPASVALREPSRLAAGCTADTLHLQNVLPKKLPDSMSLGFQTKNESVSVWVDGALVYTYGETPQKAFGHGVGAVWNLVTLPKNAGGKTVRIDLAPIGGRTGLEPYRFWLGSQGDIVSYLLQSSWLHIAVSIMLGSIGLGTLIWSLVDKLRKGRRAEMLLHFSLFVLLSTVWMVTDSGLLQFLIPNKGISYFLFGSSFYLFCTPFALFISNALPEDRRLFRMLAAVCAGYALLRIGLFVAGALDFETALWLLHLLMATMIVTVNVKLWLPQLRAKRFEHRELSLAVSAFTLVEAVSLVSFYANDKLNMQRNGYSSGFYFGILLFVVIVLIDTARQTRLMRQQAFRAQFLEKRAYTDDLTGLLNAKGFDDKCAALLQSAPQQRCYAVIDFDVNFFSQYNASNGPDAGDALSRDAADVLRGACRPDELCARQEADHFVCMAYGDTLDEIVDRVRLSDLAVRERMSSKMLLLSYGVTEVKDRGQSIAALRNQALVAKRTIKGNYENNVAVYDHLLHESQLRELKLLSSFETALEHNEYVIYLQPKVVVATGALSGAEALVRRLMPDGSVMSAGPIIEALERKGFVAKLDEYILERVCAFLRRCLDEGRAVCPISSNFSRVHLYDFSFPERVAEIVDRYRIPHELIEVELTETTFLVGKDMLGSMVDRLHSHGFRVSVDDFGSGYSSLNILKDVEIDVIKMDREFLADLMNNQRAGVIIEHTIRLAQTMGVTTVAEGIETEEHLRFLRQLGCDLVQGYYYSRPLPTDEFVERFLPAKDEASV